VADQWKTGGVPRSAIQYPGVLGLVDTNGAVISAPPTNTPWLKLDIVNGDTFPATFGGPVGLNRVIVLIQLSVFVPRNQGQQQINTLIGFAKAIFSRYQLSGLRCLESSVIDLDGGGWLAKAARTPCEFYEEVN